MSKKQETKRQIQQKIARRRRKFKKECVNCGRMFRPIGRFQRRCKNCLSPSILSRLEDSRKKEEKRYQDNLRRQVGYFKVGELYE